jgi:hypothetical protein
MKTTRLELLTALSYRGGHETSQARRERGNFVFRGQT